MLLLRTADVADIFTLADAIDIAESVYREQGNGSVTAFPRHTLVSRKSHTSIAGGALDDSGITAIRMSVNTLDDQTEYAALLFDIDNNQLLSVMAFEFSSLRTAGMVGVATKTLSDVASSVLCMVGTGRRAADYLRIACLVRPITEIRVFSRDQEKRAGFAEQMQKELDRPVLSAPTVEAALQDAEIVYVSTNSRTPVLSATSLNANNDRGRFIASMGGIPELDESVYLLANDIFVSDKARVLQRRDGDDASACQLSQLIATAKVSGGDIHEIGSVLKGERSPSSTKRGTTVFKDFAGGSGFGDAALCHAAYQRCSELQRGIFIDLH